MFNSKNILITGGTGSFGKVCAKKLLEKYKPKKIIIYSRDELKQYEMAKKYSGFKNKLRFLIGDVRDYDRLKLATKEVDYVIHAAALKQVPTAEYNPNECIKTNIYGADNIIRASLENNVKKIIALSTDKAANPINLYGATKLASDKLFISANNLVGKNKTRFSVVRYGNVVNSRGSVIPLFKELIKNKSNYLPITDLDMTRFLITLEQGVNFVLKSFFRMKGGELFIPKIPSLNIKDLANCMAPRKKIKIIGVRPGEKIHEIMFSYDDSRNTIEFNDHYVVIPTIDFQKNINYFNNNLKEKGKKLKILFEYNSGTNNFFLKQGGIKKLLRGIDKSDTL